MEGKVLIIEDSVDILENIVEILQLQHFEVITAKDAITGMELANRVKPDIILCDILIPGKGGFDVLKFVRNTAGIRSVPFVFVTSQSEKTNIQQAYDLGASGYIIKPFDGQTLIDGVEQLVRERNTATRDPGATTIFPPPAGATQ
jgi:DNA-binding response OmpR family regulator